MRPQDVFLDMLSVFSSFKTNIRRGRQLEGIAKANANWVYKGGKQETDFEKLKQEGLDASDINKEIDYYRKKNLSLSKTRVTIMRKFNVSATNNGYRIAEGLMAASSNIVRKIILTDKF